MINTYLFELATGIIATLTAHNGPLLPAMSQAARIGTAAIHEKEMSQPNTSAHTGYLYSP